MPNVRPISDEQLPPASVDLLPPSLEPSRVLELYPASPERAPAARTTTAYRLRVVVVLLSLVAFLALYFGLVAGSAYLVYASWTLWDWGLLKIGALAGSGMLFLFLLKGLFKRNQLDVSDMVEIREREQPTLFAFIKKLCEESNSPIPGKVYLSADVNAGVFYPRSLLTLFWPVRKNLVVGLGLVNVLNLTELKAVLAHEFGHFAQSSMRLGRYVYVANQVMHDMVFGRDFWDRAINKWCEIDIRLSFPAWGLKLVVWMLRKVLSGAFKGINLLNQALSREMEFDADLNAVRLTGSDALIAALWKVERGSIAWNMAADELGSVAMHGTFSDDLFYHQRRALERLSQLADKDPKARERHPSLFKDYRPGTEIHFTEVEEHAGDMWSTHPPNREREINAKRDYLGLTEDPRTAWNLVQNKKRTRKKLTRLAYRHSGRAMKGNKLTPAREVHRQILEERQEMEQAEHYHGLYDDRFVRPGDLDALMLKLDAGTPDFDALRARVARYTGDKLEKLMKRRKRVATKRAVLAALMAGQIDEDKALDVLDGDSLPAGSRQAGLEKAAAAEDKLDERLAKVDRAVFRYFYAKSASDAAVKSELVDRYRFLVAVQEHISKLNDIERKTTPVLEAVASGAELSNDDARYVIAVFAQGQEVLAGVVTACTEQPMPALFHLEHCTTVRDFVLSEEVVEELIGDRVTGEWIGAYWKQFQQTIGRLRKLHFKNLGALLRLQENLDPTLFEPPKSD
jgi:Zn-dependent protease with chaperone function